MAGEHAPVGHVREAGVGELAALGDEALEPAVAVHHQGIDGGAGLGAGGLGKPLGTAFSGEDLMSSTVTPILPRRSVTLGNWKITPMEPTMPLRRETMWSAPMAAI